MMSIWRLRGITLRNFSMGGFPKKFAYVPYRRRIVGGGTGKKRKGFQIGNPNNRLNLVPKFGLKFGQLFTAEAVKHLVVERTEEQATMLEFVCV